MVVSSSARLRLAVVGLVGFLFACGGNGGTADAGTDLQLADAERSTVSVAPAEVPADGETAAVVTVTLKNSSDQVMAEHPGAG